MSLKVILTREDLEKLTTAWSEANSLPIMVVGSSNVAAQAWQNVNQIMDELGQKYGYDPKLVNINTSTGEVFGDD